MKTTLILMFVFTVILSACTKSDLQPSVNSISATSEDNSVIKKRSALLTAHAWMYQERDFGYIDNHHRGDPQYIRGASNNIEHLDDIRFVFKVNGTFTEKGDDYIQRGNWHFSDKTASLLILNYKYYTNNDSILVLTNNNLNYTEPFGYHSKIYTELITAK